MQLQYFTKMLHDTNPLALLDERDNNEGMTVEIPVPRRDRYGDMTQTNVLADTHRESKRERERESTHDKCAAMIL